MGTFKGNELDFCLCILADYYFQALVRPNFIRSQVADLDLYETHIQILFSKIPRDGSMVDLQPLFFQLTLDSATEFLFGESVSSLTSVEGSSQHRFGKMFDLAQNRLNLRARLGKLVMVYRDKEFDRACQIVHEFVDEIIYRALERFEPRDAEKPIDGSGEKKRYVFLNELLKSTRDPKRLRDELLNILMAGRDTTASLLSHTFHLLARRPDIWQKLQAEIAELNGTKPDYDTLRNLKYVKYVLNECKSPDSKWHGDKIIADKPSSSLLSCRALQWEDCGQRYNLASWRRTQWGISLIRSKGRNRWIHSMGNAQEERHLRP